LNRVAIVVAFCLLLMLVGGCSGPVPPPGPAPARPPDPLTPGLAEAVAKDVVDVWSGLVVAAYDQGELGLLRGFGKVSADSDVTMSPHHLFPIPVLSELLIGVLAGALHEGEVLNLDAPISSYMPGLTAGLGRLHLSQLLTHTSGLDDAAPPEDDGWVEIIDDLDDRALFTEPGAIFSHSRYSYPLALRVLEAATQMPFRELVIEAILGPLGMDRSTFDPDAAVEMGLVQGFSLTYDPVPVFRAAEIKTELEGIPVLFSTSADVLRFLVAWMDGGIRGQSPLKVIPEGTPSIPGSPGLFGGGVWVDEYRGLLRVSRTQTGSGLSSRAPFPPKPGVGVGIHLFPHSRSAFVIWGVGRVPARTSLFILEKLSMEVALRGEIGMGFPSPGLERMLSNEPPDIGPLEGWAGLYVNGEYFVELRAVENGLVYVVGTEILELREEEGGTIAAKAPVGPVAFRLRFLRDADGRHYVILPDIHGNDRAYLHEDDKGS
jgi:CubicO group peptidase (beta-lactamase class C family)